MVTLGHAGLLGVAGYGLAILTVDEGWPLAPRSSPRSPLRSWRSAFFGLLVVRSRGTYFVMITLAQGMVMWGIAQRWQELTGGENGVPGVPKPDFAQEYWQYYYLVLVVVALCTFFIGRLVRSPFGLSLKGIREAEDRLAPLGYNVARPQAGLPFTISGFFAGVSGLLLAMYNSFIGPSDVFFLASAEGLLMSILGGIGTITGAFVGAGVVVYITNWASLVRRPLADPARRRLRARRVFAPDGIVGAWTRWCGRRCRGASARATPRRTPSARSPRRARAWSAAPGAASRARVRDERAQPAARAKEEARPS